MKVAIIGSRNLNPDITLDFTPDEIISGGAIGVDTCARQYAIKNNIPFTEIKPNYEVYNKSAPIIRNKIIVEKCDTLIAYWDGKSSGTKFTIDYARKLGKQIIIK